MLTNYLQQQKLSRYNDKIKYTKNNKNNTFITVTYIQSNFKVLNLAKDLPAITGGHRFIHIVVLWYQREL